MGSGAFREFRRRDRPASAMALNNPSLSPITSSGECIAAPMSFMALPKNSSSLDGSSAGTVACEAILLLPPGASILWNCALFNPDIPPCPVSDPYNGGMTATRYLLASLGFVLPLIAAPKKASFLVYIGTYTGEKSKGIYAYRFHPDSGEVDSLGLAAETDSPSYFAIHPNRRFLYAVNEKDNFGGQKSGSVTAFAIEPKTGRLRQLNQVSSRGTGACHLVVDKTGETLFAANYESGSVAAFPVRKNGSLGEAVGFDQHTGSGADPRRQRQPHAHCVTLSPDNRFVAAADLGLDKIFIYHVDPRKSSLVANDPPFVTVKPGSGPRHVAFSPDAAHAYVISEMASTVTAFSYDAKAGALSEIQTISTLPSGFSGDSTTAEIVVDAKGKFLYGSNRGHDSIAVFAIDPAKGTLTSIEHVSTRGKVPRNFAIDPTGAYLFAANQNSNNIVLFHIDPNTGRLTPAGKTLEVGSPVCVVFVRN
jgi:6-phosphogluconolactonase